MIAELGFALLVMGGTGAFAAAVAAPSAVRWPALIAGVLLMLAGDGLILSQVAAVRRRWDDRWEKAQGARRSREAWRWRTGAQQNPDGTVTIWLDWPSAGWHDRTPSPWADRAIVCVVDGPTDDGVMRAAGPTRSMSGVYVEFPGMFTPTLAPPPLLEGTYEVRWEIEGERKRPRRQFSINEYGGMAR